MGGTIVKQPLPAAGVNQISPFLLLHHFGPTTVAPGGDPLDVGPHPHRGFEPVTFLYSGGIRHKDSRGNEGLLRGGDVQWMTAGRGIIHSERASKEFLEEGGTMEGIQLWVNLPKANKMEQPNYQDIKQEQIPVTNLDNGLVELRVVAGEYLGLKGPASTFTSILALQLQFEANGKAVLELPEDHEVLAYVLSGEVEHDGNVLNGEHMAYFKKDGPQISLKANQESRVLLLSGKPIDEPVAQWGPYVMNTQTEILEAMRDYQKGAMGVYID